MEVEGSGRPPAGRPNHTPVPALLSLLILILASDACAQTTDGARITTAEDFPQNVSRTNEPAVVVTAESVASDRPTWTTGANKSEYATNRITTGLPDVTATSQKILLLTEHSTNGTGHSRRDPTPLQSRERTDVSETRTAAPVTLSSSTTTTSSSSSSSIPSSDLSPKITDPSTSVATSFDIVTTYNATSAAGNESRVAVVLKFVASCDDLAESLGVQLPGWTAASGPISCLGELRVRTSVSNPSRLQSQVGRVRVRLSDGTLDYTLEEVEVVEEGRHWLGSLAGPLSVREVVAYAVVGAVFGLAVLVALALLCCKCCCSGSRRDSRDVPRLAHRLEDYSLTRIPRPSTLFSSVRNGTSPPGVVPASRQSFDTSVVPLDEQADPLRRGYLRSFSGRRSRPDPSLPDVPGRGGSPALYGSSERLARHFGGRTADRGNDNQVFRF